MISRSSLLLAFAGIVLSAAALAQSPSSKRAAAPAQAAAQAAEDPLGRTTPHGTVLNFITAVEKRDRSRAAQYLDGRLGAEQKAELAVQLKQLMDKRLKLDLNTLSKSPGGNADDGLPLDRESLGEIVVGESKLEIMLDRVQRGENPPVWLFSAETLKSLRELPKEDPQVSLMERVLPVALVEKSLFGFALYRWILVPLTLLVIAVIAWIATGLLSPRIQRFFRSRPGWGAFVRGTSYVGPARLLVFALLMWLVAQFGATLMTRQRWTQLALLLIAVAAGWLFMRAINPVASGFVGYMQSTQQHHRIALVHLLRGLAKFIAVVTVLLVILSLQGVNLTAAVAGIGIGGIALAFAAQKTLENVFGTVMLVADQPIRVGDLCRLGDTMGVIEDIGMRSTRVRTVERTIVTVPNGQASSMIVENFASRDKMWFKHPIGLRYETTPEQLRHVLASVHKLLSGHPQVESDSARIRLLRFGGSSLDLEACAYLLATDIASYLKIQEELLLQIMDAIEASGTALAFPSQTTYLAKDPGLDAAKFDAAIAEVRRSAPGEARPAAA
jgi:MscS family membrane protein